jgi:hypothetical protein
MMPQGMSHAQQNSATQDSAQCFLQRRRWDDVASNISALCRLAGTPSAMEGNTRIVGGGKEDIKESPRRNAGISINHMIPGRVKKLPPNNNIANALIERVNQMTHENIAKLQPSVWLNVWHI